MIFPVTYSLMGPARIRPAPVGEVPGTARTDSDPTEAEDRSISPPLWFRPGVRAGIIRPQLMNRGQQNLRPSEYPCRGSLIALGQEVYHGGCEAVDNAAGAHEFSTIPTNLTSAATCVHPTQPPIPAWLRNCFLAGELPPKASDRGADPRVALERSVEHPSWCSKRHRRQGPHLIPQQAKRESGQRSADHQAVG